MNYVTVRDLKFNFPASSVVYQRWDETLSGSLSLLENTSVDNAQPQIPIHHPTIELKLSFKK